MVLSTFSPYPLAQRAYMSNPWPRPLWDLMAYGTLRDHNGLRTCAPRGAPWMEPGTRHFVVRPLVSTYNILGKWRAEDSVSLKGIYTCSCLSHLFSFSQQPHSFLVNSSFIHFYRPYNLNQDTTLTLFIS